MCASIDTREWRYHFNSTNHLPPEHSRSSPTDDIKCFFSVLMDCTGNIFTLKRNSHAIITIMQVYYEWRKVSLEFSKQMDPSLPFYYFTNNQEFYEGEMPGFNEPRNKPPKED